MGNPVCDYYGQDPKKVLLLGEQPLGVCACLAVILAIFTILGGKDPGEGCLFSGMAIAVGTVCALGVTQLRRKLFKLPDSSSLQVIVPFGLVNVYVCLLTVTATNGALPLENTAQGIALLLPWLGAVAVWRIWVDRDIVRALLLVSLGLLTGIVAVMLVMEVFVGIFVVR